LDNPKKRGEDTGIKSITCLSKYIRIENNKPIGMGNADDEIPMDKDTIYTYMERTTIAGLKGTLYTDDYQYAAMVIQLNEDADFDKVIEKVRDAIDHRGTKYTNMEVTGTIAMQQAIQKESMRNLVIVFPVAIILVSIILFIFHRDIKGILVAFIPPAFALALTFGVLGMAAPELTLISVAIVALLMGLGVDYSIHLMNRLAEEKKIENTVDRIEKILRSTGKAVLLSTITTVIGFASLMISSMSPMVTFGFGCAIGIMFCFISAVLLVPCLVLILDIEKTREAKSWKKFANFALKYSKRMIIIAVFLSIMSLILLPQVETNVNYFDMAPAGVRELDTMYEYSDQFGTGGNFNAFLIKTDPGGLEDPGVINQIYEMEKEMEAAGVTVTSIADSLKEIYDLLDRNKIIQTFANLTEADNIIFDKIAQEGIVDEDRSQTLILVSIPVGLSIKEIGEIVNKLNSIAEREVLPHNGRISKLTGQDAINVAVNKKLFDEQMRSMIIALILVLAALIFIFNSSLYGILTMIPVFFVLTWEPGFLVATEIPLSLITITIASIMVGIGIDYGVHITHRVREEMEQGLSKIDATRKAIEKTGLSLVEAALTTVAGMGSIYIVNIAALREFVTVIVFMVAVSCVAAAFLLPAFYQLKIVK
jgi:hydrophobe/amphiphile efflux-3 (HAE3) family protein